MNEDGLDTWIEGVESRKPCSGIRVRVSRITARVRYCMEFLCALRHAHVTMIRGRGGGQLCKTLVGRWIDGGTIGEQTGGKEEAAEADEDVLARAVAIVCGEWALYGVMGEGLRVTEGF